MLESPLLDDLAQAIVQNSGDEIFDELKQVNRPAPADLKLTRIFDETVAFGSIQISPYILIFDGWDEISVSASEGFRQRIEETLRATRREFLGNRTYPIRVILTGRPSLDVEESRFLQSETAILTVRPFTEIQLKNFSAALLEYRLKDKDGDRPRLSKRIENLIDHSRRAQKTEEEGKLGILGLPLLAMLAIWLSLNDDAAPDSVGTDETTLYRRLVDLTCRHGGSVEEITAAPRIVGDQLRELLRRTAAAMTMRGTEHISYTELERRLKDSGVPARDELIRSVMKENPIANLMISFFFNVGSREHGCEFIHKTFREYLFAECIVETLKNIDGNFEGLPLRTPYWKDFSNDDPRYSAVRRLMPLLASQWLMPEVARHLHALLGWEIDRSMNPKGHLLQSKNETRAVQDSKWRNIRDLLSDLWDWWAEGVHLRPQPFIRDDTSSLDYKEIFSSWLGKTIAPIDLPRGELPEPIRMTTIDAHLGDALFQITCTVHFAINKATGWLELTKYRTKSIDAPFIPERLWNNSAPRPSRRYQTRITRGNQHWIAFAPNSPDGKNHYMQAYSYRVNAAGWRPQGEFPAGIDMSGIDLADAVFQRFESARSKISFRYARLEHARLDQSHFGHYSDFEYCLGSNLQCHLVAGGHINFRNAVLTRAIFRNALLWNAGFDGANVKDADFSGADLDGVDATHLAASNTTGARFFETEKRNSRAIRRRNRKDSAE